MSRAKQHKNPFGLQFVLRRKFRGSRGSEEGVRVMKGGERTVMKSITREAPNALLLSLSVLAESADVCPPLKSVLGVLNFIVLQIQEMKGIKQDAQIVYDRVTMLLDFLCEIISDATNIPPPLLNDIQDLNLGLLSINDQMDKINKKKLIGRLLHVRRDKDRLAIAKDGLDTLVRCFTMKCSIRTEVAASSIPRIAASVEDMDKSFRECVAAQAVMFDSYRRAFTIFSITTLLFH